MKKKWKRKKWWTWINYSYEGEVNNIPPKSKMDQFSLEYSSAYAWCWMIGWSLRLLLLLLFPETVEDGRGGCELERGFPPPPSLLRGMSDDWENETIFTWVYQAGIDYIWPSTRTYPHQPKNWKTTKKKLLVLLWSEPSEQPTQNSTRKTFGNNIITKIINHNIITVHTNKNITTIIINTIIRIINNYIITSNTIII